VRKYFKCRLSPLEIEYIPTGQKIYFRGLDDPLKITSITVKTGCLCWLWIEEAYEISDESDFNMLDESIRGAVPDGLFKQITITLNPWNEKHWIKRRFFDAVSDEIMAKSTDYRCNEFLDSADLKVFEDMKKNNPSRYKVAGLGNWGISEGLVYENWHEEKFNIDEIKKINGIKTVFGLDFGYVNDPTALFCGIADEKNKKLYVFDELYEKALSNEEIYEKICKMGYTKEKIRADCAEPKSIDRLRNLGLKGIRAARKGKDSINNGIDYIQNYEVLISSKCVNFINEISNYTWAKDKEGRLTNKPLDEYNHLMDAMRYAMEELIRGENFGFE
jgi:phage terminase large subunit